MRGRTILSLDGLGGPNTLDLNGQALAKHKGDTLHRHLFGLGGWWVGECVYVWVGVYVCGCGCVVV